MRALELTASSAAHLPTVHGDFQICCVQDEAGTDHVILSKGDVRGRAAVPVRVHSECLTSEVFGSQRCDCREQLVAALEHFEAKNLGILIYLRQEGRGIGLFKKIEAYALQDDGLDTVEANVELGLPIDSRSYAVAAQILHGLEVKSVRLLTNNPRKLEALRRHGVHIVDRIPLHVAANPVNDAYLSAKRTKLAHLF